MLNGAGIFTMISLVPVILAIIVAATHYKKISVLWIIVLVLSLFSGGGFIVALVFLRCNINVFQKEAPVVITGQVLTAQPGVYTNAVSGSTPPTIQVAPKKGGTILATIVSVVLWVSGLAVVGFFVIVTIIAIQCANDPKCM
ncbi:MAG: hypothetical protein WCJ86_03095 [Candidatus Saccharibacteria bacterium]